MLKQKEVYQIVKKLVTSSNIKVILLFGSSVSKDCYGESDTDMAIITESAKNEKEINTKINFSHFYLQTHIFSIKDFTEKLKDGDPLCLGILYTGKVLYGKNFHLKLKKKGFKPINKTIRKCMLNSFAALGLGISDLTSGFLYDSVNSIYHAARSSIWADLFDKVITPNNNHIFKLLEDKSMLRLYKKIIEFRQNIPNNNYDLYLAQEIYVKGNINSFTQLLDDATTIVRTNYKRIFGKNFVSFFELLAILRKRYDNVPEFYSVMLSVVWKKQKPVYHVMLCFKDKRIFVEVDENNGSIKEIENVKKEV